MDWFSPASITIKEKQAKIKTTLFIFCLFQAENSCDQSSMKVPTSHDGAYDVTVLVHTPKVNSLCL